MTINDTQTQGFGHSCLVYSYMHYYLGIKAYAALRLPRLKKYKVPAKVPNEIRIDMPPIR